MTNFNVVFDLDDTLIPNGWRYLRAKFRCSEIIFRALSGEVLADTSEWIRFKLAEVSCQCGAIIVNALINDSPHNLKLVELVHRATGMEQNFSDADFQRSWKLVYERICQESGREVDPLVLMRLQTATSKLGRNPYKSLCSGLSPDDLPLIYGGALLSLQGDIDRGLIERYGLSRHRFHESWVEAYQTYCRRVGQEPDPVVSRRVRGAAARFQRGPFRAFPEAIEALRKIGSQGHVLHLSTAGERKLQRRKIEQAGLEPFFAGRIHIVPLDKRSVLRRIANGRPRETIMIGDSLMIDVAAAVDVGIRAVFIPTNGNGWMDESVNVDPGDYTQLESIRDLPALINEWSANHSGKPRDKKTAKRR
jgi:FMN phosphatase YigB (HAD superfamily)